MQDMKFIRNIIVLVILGYGLFSFRTEIAGYFDDVLTTTQSSTIDRTDWGGSREKAYESYKFADADTAIYDMNNYLPFN